MIHDLKCIQPFFKEIWAGKKTWELRKDDRGFAIGDGLKLSEYDPELQCYTGLRINARITTMLGAGSGLADQIGGLKKDYCILGIEIVSREG